MSCPETQLEQLKTQNAELTAQLKALSTLEQGARARKALLSPPVSGEYALAYRLIYKSLSGHALINELMQVLRKSGIAAETPFITHYNRPVCLYVPTESYLSARYVLQDYWRGLEGQDA